MPLFAQLLHGILHPWSILVAFVTKSDGMDLLIVLHVATGAVGVGVLVRTLGATRGGAAVAGLSYGLSGYLLGMSAVIQYLAAAGSAPWAIAALRHSARGGPTRFALGAVGMALLLFAGDPQWAIVAALLGILLAWEANGREGVAWATCAAILGSALAGIQLIPTWDFLKDSNRGAGLTYQDKLQWAFVPARIIEFVVPGFFAGRPGLLPASVYRWLGGESTYPMPFLPSVFLGLPVLILAASGLRTSRITRVMGWSALFFLWLSLGHFAGADTVFGWVPVWSSFRYSEKLIGPFTLCVSTLAGLGLEPFVNNMLPRLSRHALIYTITAMALAAFSAILARFASPPSFISSEVWNLLGERFAAGFLLSAIGSGLVACASLHSKRECMAEHSAKKWILSAVLVTGLSGSAAALHVGTKGSRALTPLQELRTNDQVVRIYATEQDITLPIYKGLDYFDAHQAVRSRTGDAPYTVPSHIDSFMGYTGLLPQRFNDLIRAFNAFGNEKYIMYRRFALSHVLVTPPLSPTAAAMTHAAISDGKLVSFDPEWNISVWQVPHRPWASFAETVMPVSGEPDAVAAVANLEKSRSRTVVLRAAPPSILSPGLIHSIERSPHHIRIEAETSKGGLLVVADAFWKGWKATIDKKPVDIYQADAMVRAVRWPAGRHILEMHYEPAAVLFGAIVSFGSSVLLLAFVIGATLRHRQRTIECAGPP